MIRSEAITGLPEYEVTGVGDVAGRVRIQVRFTVEVKCPHCGDQKHFYGISRSRWARRERIASATIERWFVWYLRLLSGERIRRECPEILGIDEHFFTRRQGYATTFCDLKNHKVHDVVL